MSIEREARSSVVLAQQLAKTENSPSGVSRSGFNAVAIRCAELFADGYDLASVARIMMVPLTPRHSGDRKTRLKSARKKLRSWRRKENFRDLVYDLTIVRIDNEVPKIITGLLGKAAAGRVDAARLLLELNGRHAPNADVVPAAIHINFQGVPRPVAEAPELNGQATGNGTVAEDEIIDGEFEDA